MNSDVYFAKQASAPRGEPTRRRLVDLFPNFMTPLFGGNSSACHARGSYEVYDQV